MPKRRRTNHNTNQANAATVEKPEIQQNESIQKKCAQAQREQERLEQKKREQEKPAQEEKESLLETAPKPQLPLDKTVTGFTKVDESDLDDDFVDVAHSQPSFSSFVDVDNELKKDEKLAQEEIKEKEAEQANTSYSWWNPARLFYGSQNNAAKQEAAKAQVVETAEAAAAAISKQ